MAALKQSSLRSAYWTYPFLISHVWELYHVGTRIVLLYARRCRTQVDVSRDWCIILVVPPLCFRPIRCLGALFFQKLVLSIDCTSWSSLMDEVSVLRGRCKCCRRTSYLALLRILRYWLLDVIVASAAARELRMRVYKDCGLYSSY